VTTHDGSTLRDLVSYNVKHNEANGEHNRDGTDDNRSWNCGVEGPTDDADVTALRTRQSRALLATPLLSLGMPMLVGGDELGRTQGGNNNAYCQDGPISWFDWDNLDADLLDYTAALIALRRDRPALRRRRYVTRARPGEISWFTAAGTAMTEADWTNPLNRAVAVRIDGCANPDRDEHGRPMIDADLMVLTNGWWEPIPFLLPAAPHPDGISAGTLWRVELDTDTGLVRPTDPAVHPEGTQVTVGPRALTLLASERPGTVPWSMRPPPKDGHPR
jgi:isoamylase